MNENQKPVLIPKRTCGECTKCCEGWLHAQIYEHTLKPGSPCPYLEKNKGCTIYDERPKEICKTFKCFWLEDPNYFIPEWMKPNLSNVILMRRYWGENNEHMYIAAVECGEMMKADVLHWLILHCERNRICLEYQFNGQVYRRGNEEFNKFMDKKYGVENVKV